MTGSITATSFTTNQTILNMPTNARPTSSIIIPSLTLAGGSLLKDIIYIEIGQSGTVVLYYPPSTSTRVYLSFSYICSG